MSNIVKIVFAVFIIAFSSLSYAGSLFLSASYSRGVVLLNPNTGAIIQCTSNFNIVTPTTICKKIGTIPVNGYSSYYSIEIVGGAVNQNAIIVDRYTGRVTQCTLLSMGTGSCKTDYPPT